MVQLVTAEAELCGGAQCALKHPRACRASFFPPIASAPRWRRGFTWESFTMKYFYLTSTDRRTNDFVFYKYWEKPGLYLTPELRALCRPDCNKLDQDAAIRRHLFQGDILTKVNWFHALDGPLCVTSTGRKALEDSGSKGLVFQPFCSPKGKSFWMVFSAVRVPTRTPECSQFGPVCKKCGRYRYILGLPAFRHYEMPPDDTIVFEGSIPSETEFCLQTWLVASKTIVDRLRAAKLSGFRCFEVDP